MVLSSFYYTTCTPVQWHNPTSRRRLCPLVCPALQAGGKDGVVAVWGSRQLEAGALPAHEAEAPLLAHKLHKGWGE